MHLRIRMRIGPRPFAHFVHIVATMDTALDLGFAGGLSHQIDDPYTSEDFDTLIRAFLPITEKVNEINRSMGQPDMYPFVLSDVVMGKLHFIHMIVAKHARALSTPIRQLYDIHC